MIQRIFHPVGQGAFYSERHNNFNMVFDCGCWPPSKNVDKVINGSFKEGSDIDILFISHFDSDHVSKIKLLKNKYKINRVVLPYLHKETKYLLYNIYKSLNSYYDEKLLFEPESYFREGTNIITVKSYVGNLDNITRDVESLNTEEVESGTVIKKNDWCFVPYNFEYTNRYNELHRNLQKARLDEKKLSEDIVYAISNRKKISAVYNKLKGGINCNSLVLYSGPRKTNKIYYSCLVCLCRYSFYRECCYNHHKPGCVYTGDADLNEYDLKKELKQYWDNVGTIQVPHHGDMKSFSKELISDRSYLLPISFGTNNKHGHPNGQLLVDIINSGSYPIFITERLDSIFIEQII